MSYQRFVEAMTPADTRLDECAAAAMLRQRFDEVGNVLGAMASLVADHVDGDACDQLGGLLIATGALIATTGPAFEALDQAREVRRAERTRLQSTVVLPGHFRRDLERVRDTLSTAGEILTDMVVAADVVPSNDEVRHHIRRLAGTIASAMEDMDIAWQSVEQ